MTNFETATANGYLRSLAGACLTAPAQPSRGAGKNGIVSVEEALAAPLSQQFFISTGTCVRASV